MPEMDLIKGIPGNKLNNISSYKFKVNKII